MRIHQLPKEVYDLIAAGEVVLAPVSVVKELVENSLDAGASRIVVEITSGGIDKVRVSDNGFGIERDDIKLAFAPHATSKLREAEELTKIETLGFRGEALASIAAVSCVTLVTKTAGETGATRAIIEGGADLRFEPIGADNGTDVTVERLFFNLPARQKHLGDARAEGRRITEYLSKAAVSRADAAFRLISDGDLVFSSLGNGDRLSAIAAVYGSRIAENLIPISAERGGLRVEGYISGVLGLRSNRKGQHFFVNGRPVLNLSLENAVTRAYREFAEPGRFPVLVLLLTTPPDMVDINIHPGKSEVSFAKPGEIEEFVYSSVLDILHSGSVIPRLRVPGWKSEETVFRLSNPEGPGAIPGKTIEKSTDTLINTSGGVEEKVKMVDINMLLSTENQTGLYENLVDHNKLRLSESEESLNEQQSLNISTLRMLAVLFATYILATDGDSFYIIDQHAAHERVNYDLYRKAYYTGEVVVQGLLMPYLFTPPAILVNLSEYVGFLGKLGYEIDEFGENTWAARSFPAFVSFEEGETFLLETLDALGTEAKNGAEIGYAAVERIMMRACKASVKANQTLSNEEYTALFEALSGCENPYTCPHGRPVFLQLTRGDIERLFKRA